VLALELGGREPHFTLVLGGEPLLTAASHTAPFHVLLLFLHAANTAHGARPCMRRSCCPNCPGDGVCTPARQMAVVYALYGVFAWQCCWRLGAVFLTRSHHQPGHREHPSMASLVQALLAAVA
jgi:hypothetical protein